MKLFRWLARLCKPAESNNTNNDTVSKFLIVGLGNVGAEYEGTRHNAGFMVVDALAKEAEASWTLERHAYRTEVRHRGHTLVLIKPTTFMNLSGKAVRYWLQAERLEISRLLVVVDDIALEPGTIRMKKQGSGGGHNGLADIEQALGTQGYCRLRIGVGNHFGRGQQIDYVLGRMEGEDAAKVEEAVKRAAEAIKCFATLGADRAMNIYNTKA